VQVVLVAAAKGGVRGVEMLLSQPASRMRWIRMPPERRRDPAPRSKLRPPPARSVYQIDSRRRKRRARDGTCDLNRWRS
jgi:hypothetical protein